MDRDYILHLLRVAKLAMNFSKIYFNDDNITNVAFICGLTHDIGKLEVDKNILNKNGKLTELEFEEMKKHSLYSYELLKLAGLNGYSEIALYHHERYDGKGYPLGLKNDELPIIAKIISICDVFDAMTSERIYRDSINIEDTIKFIKEQSGKRFDPDLVDYFINNIKKILYINELESYRIA